jgi:hypothetical protein
MMTARSKQTFPQRYFQRIVDTKEKEIRRLNLKILELERLEQRWPKSADIKKDLRKYRIQQKSLVNDLHRYLYRIS